MSDVVKNLMTEHNLTKFRDAVQLKRISQVCYRELKYKEGDVRRKCHMNFNNIQDECYHCKWYVGKTDRTLTALGEDIEKLVNFVSQYFPKGLDRHKNVSDNKAYLGSSDTEKQGQLESGKGDK